MDAALSGGDFLRAANGKPYLTDGTAEMFQRAAIRLTVPAGRFCYDASLGSRLSSLMADSTDADALLLAQEALRDLPGVSALSARYTPGDNPTVKITLSCGGTQKEIEVKL